MIAAFCCACALLSIINTSPLHPTSSLGILSFASLASSLVIPFSFDLLQMSQLPIKSPKHCAKHGLNVDKLYKRLFYAFSTFLISVLSVVFLVWLILRPSKPEFHLKEADIYQLNLSGPHLLNTSIQITLVSKNPNQKVGVYYDQLQVYASYKGQQITLDTSLPPFYQGHEDRNLLTASLVGIGLPVAPSFGYEVGRDQTTGKLILSLKVNGRLRWKVGTWVSGRYRFNVECVAIMAFEPNAVSSPLSSKQGTQCSTSV
ncbi:PREDICTED: NDR1/HIN1-like protein 12 [Nelumbo nucifera]|uniref:NDR1/HIN1-like protein 12 n=1 Tax=Nelumbo nucifera TaxID=4432 RepID=A0A1U7ZIQ0_NELNU|nr:PREDICTED: NDR1/HIN1-like protein 12 [Nelumbo nucifera]